MQTKKPKVSVVMSIYNEELFLDESISSILNQTLKDFEFIIINNGSKDNSLAIIKKYMKKDKRIQLINEKTNLGTSRAINKGWNKAKGEYIAVFCGDDYSFPRRLEIQSRYLNRREHIFLVGTSAIYMDEAGREIRRFRKYDDYKLLAWRLRKSCSIVFPSIMFRNRDVSMDPNVNTNDYDFYFRLLKRGENLSNIPLFLVKHRVHSESVSVSDNRIFEKSRDEIVERFKKIPDTSSIFLKARFYGTLALHYLKTRREKRKRTTR